MLFVSFRDADSLYITETAKQDSLLTYAITNIAKTPAQSLDIFSYYYKNLSDYDNAAEIIYNYASANYYMGKLDSTRKIFDRHFQDSRLLNNRPFYGRSLHLYSVLYKNDSRYTEALKLLFKALDIARLSNDKMLCVTCQNSISGIHFILKDFDKAKSSLINAINMLDSSDQNKKYYDMNLNLASIYCFSNQYSKALNLLNKCEKWYFENNYFYSLPAVYNVIHIIYNQRSEFDSALHYSKKMLEYNDYNNHYSTSIAFTMLANAYRKAGNLKKSHSYFSKAISLAQIHHYTSLLLSNYKHLYQSFEELGEIDSAFYYLKKLRELEEKSDTKSVNKTFEVYEINSKLEAKDSTIAKIESNNDSYINILKSMTLTFGFFTIIAFVFNHRKQKKLQSLIEEKEKIETSLKIAEEMFTDSKSNQFIDSKIARCIYREFREQIQAIMFSSDILESEIKSNSFVKNYSAPIKILNQTSGLLRRFLDYMILYNDLNNDEIDIQLEQTNISEITDRCIKILTGKLNDKKLNIIHSRNFYNSYSDRHLVEFIIMCLISNAIKYSTPHSTIEIKYELFQGTLFCTVTDSGLGIDANAINIENPDRIQSRSGTHGEKGTGMSLIIAHKMAKLMGSNITYQNNKDRGASFTLVLPQSLELV